MSTLQSNLKDLHKNETLKVQSNFLRGTIAESLQDTSTGAIHPDDTQLTKFHGLYQQDDRDVRAERRKKKLEPAYSFMVRLRIPGGVLSPRQYLKLDQLADERANGTLRLTTRQTFQFHGIIKGNLKPAMQGINACLIDTIAACGDVNRNVMAAANPLDAERHPEILALAHDISTHLLPRTRAYHEIWLDGELAQSSEQATEIEPLYGKQYLPRKFKVVIAVPPDNDVDIFAHDLGYIAIVDQGRIVGYNVTVGGGMGMTHGRTDTFPRTADLLGFCTPGQALQVAEAVLTTQRDHGNRADRARARLKYTIETMGLDAFQAEVHKRLGFSLEAPRPFTFNTRGDRYGWTEGKPGNWHYTLFVENGRIKDRPAIQLKTGLRAIAHIHQGTFRCSANQNIIIADVPTARKSDIEAALEAHGLQQFNATSALRRNAMACVALPTCGLALAESERYLPALLNEIEETLEATGLRNDEISIRMTGCPNGCARPYLGEIGLVGKGPRTYNLYLGAAFTGERLNKLYRADIKDREIAPTLKPILQDFAKTRQPHEHFGDFVIRKGYIQPTTAGNRFHDS